MTYRECRDIIFDSCEDECFTRKMCEEIIITSRANKGKGIPERTWKALFNNNLLCENEDGTFSFVIQTEKPKKKSGERQKHGFKFEDYAKTLFNIQPCPKGHYTYKWDGMLNGHPVSIKTEKINSDVEMASFTRNASNTDDFYLIVGFWRGEKENIVEIKTLFISGNEWHELFDQNIVQECQDFLNSVTNNVSDDEKWKIGREALTAKWKEQTTNLVRPRFKRDHKDQKRMQCAINNGDFYNYFVPKYAIDLEK